MDAKKRILVLHGRDRLGRAIVQQLEAAQVPLREINEPRPVLSAANMPGVCSLVLVVHKTSDSTVLRRRDVPYTVVRAPRLLEDVISALEPAVDSGRLVLDENGDVPLTFVATEDAAACAIAAVDHDDYCGRIVDLAAPGHFTISTVAMAIAKAWRNRSRHRRLRARMRRNFIRVRGALSRMSPQHRWKGEKSMRWECTECGCRIERPRPPSVCRSCGTAGAVFVEADGGIEQDMEADGMFDSWLHHRMDVGPPRRAA